MRTANWVGSSRLKPEVSRDVSKSNQIKSFTVLSDLSAAAFFLSSDMMECFGFTSMVFGDHVRCHGVVPQGLCLHDALHVCSPAILGGCEHTRGVGHTAAHDHLLHLVTQRLLHQL